MIVDTSAIVAILTGEEGAEALSSALLDAGGAQISAATLVELFAVVDSRSAPEQRRRVDALLAAYRITVTPFTAEHAAVAREAYRDFGRGSGHPARLDLGDCYSYALAAVAKEPILFVGDDFTRTDLRSALAP
ncbi:ribonuclease VapC [Sediminihabitans luteus]|uniref:Ribonuclease VapC n=1 Tax=Sediminihabitans luteus TaxID=1138585 RepID=A0A2M9D1D3_9CELL|nr:type II toxin-antitoxin system VapC family toxin [Sediminihabitans luteus]PJJ77895.1 ribonuclease VapC [Sediminihabitans luteus]GII99748.1 ribonuclease VapC42 [Sediminihabitans luteus]